MQVDKDCKTDDFSSSFAVIAAALCAAFSTIFFETDDRRSLFILPTNAANEIGRKDKEIRKTNAAASFGFNVTSSHPFRCIFLQEKIVYYR